MSPPTTQPEGNTASLAARVPFVAVAASGASLARGRSVYRVIRFALVACIALGSAAMLAAAIQYVLAGSSDASLIVFLIWLSAACGVTAPVGWLILSGLRRRSALRILKRSTRGERLGGRLWVADAFGARGRRGLVRWVHRRGLPPMLFAGIEPDSQAFAEVQVEEQVSLFSDPRSYPVARPALFRGGFSLPLILGIVGVMTVSEFLGLWDGLWTGIALICGLAAWRTFANRRGKFGRAEFDPNGVFRVLLVDLSGVSDSQLGREERHFAPSDSLLLIEIEGGPASWRGRNPLTVPVRVTLIDERGRSSMFRLFGTDNPSIADLGARWLEGWRMAKQAAPNPPR